MIYIYNSNNKFQKQIEYVFMNIFSFLGLKYSYEFDKNSSLKRDDILIIYDELESKEYYKDYVQNIITIKPSGTLFSESYLKRDSIPSKIRKYEFKNGRCICDNIISIFNDRNELYIKYNIENKKIIETNIDIISDIFFMLSRYEEVVNEEVYENEKFKRFSASESIIFKNNFLHRPIVNEHIELLWSLIDSFNLGYKKKKWWGIKEFAACLTHDVDMVMKFNSIKSIVKPIFKLMVKNIDMNKIFSIVDIYLRNNYRKDPFWTFDYIMNIEKKYSFKSSFYFMSGGNSKFDNFYSIEDEKVLRLINNMEKNGFEAGYHCSFNSYNNFNVMEREKSAIDKILNNKSYGCRQHFLRFRAPLTWKLQEKLGFLYDSTLSYADAEGFRCGTCIPYKPYDLLEDRVLNIIEIPLIVMDGSLQNPDYRAYSPKEGLGKTKSLIEVVKKYNGVFTILYHNSSFDYYNHMWDGWKETYEETMSYLCKSNCYGTNGREIVKMLNIR
ncbi:hypothetical protein CDLVIII_2734 [Clostridium sp. DL-VIII]|uniref:polysaccharide deacetylase family protein n=1 Tax=Clostridium sp. DL-VIII TaxID=641107 RepID=UPI00023AF947|nr:polysaccharide deacetylase family protein [Clostridium sp. DL-VIII]EHI99333.1 hypothetical protein CDLVIII_2734 [Clostridium sp. DL-VIII]